MQMKEKKSPRTDISTCSGIRSKLWPRILLTLSKATFFLVQLKARGSVFPSQPWLGFISSPAALTAWPCLVTLFFVCFSLVVTPTLLPPGGQSMLRGGCGERPHQACLHCWVCDPHVSWHLPSRMMPPGRDKPLPPL